MLVQDDVTDVLGMAWNENGVTTDFETNGDYAAQFNAIRTAFGESDVITDLTDNTVTFTDAEGGSVLLSFDNEQKTFVPIVSEIENGTPNMFKRTINVNDSDVTFVCDADGKVCWFNNNGNFLLLINDDEITPTVDAALMNSLVAATGGSTEITNEQSSDDDYNKYTNGDYSFVTESHGGVTFGEVNEWPLPNNRLYAIEVDGGVLLLGTAEGKAIFLKYNGAENYIQIVKDGVNYNFDDTVGTMTGAETEEVIGQSTDNVVIDFEFGGVSYQVNTIKYNDPTWITPNNITEYA